MLVFHHENTGQNLDLKIANRLFKTVEVRIFGNDSNKSEFGIGGN
jgi:hypothetical protein